MYLFLKNETKTMLKIILKDAFNYLHIKKTEKI